MRRLLDAGIERLGVDVSPEARKRLIELVLLLERWNRVYNLTGVRSPRDMVARHLLDCLSVVPHVRGPRLLDVGTGAGLPGLVLAIARPRWHCVLLDSAAKKTRFVEQARGELALANVQSVRARIEDFRPRECFSTIISRAFLRTAGLAEHCAALLCAGGRLLAMKGRYPEAELAELAGLAEAAGGLRPRARVLPLAVPGLEDAERHLVVLEFD